MNLLSESTTLINTIGGVLREMLLFFINSCLQVHNSYQLTGIDIGTLGINYIDYHSSETMPACQNIYQLERACGCRKHVISVDVDVVCKTILDTIESYGLELTQDNLDYCAGKHL